MSAFSNGGGKKEPEDNTGAILENSFQIKRCFQVIRVRGRVVYLDIVLDM
jgi:hypothetical protein